jgi:hypothetical protein
LRYNIKIQLQRERAGGKYGYTEENKIWEIEGVVGKEERRNN